MKKKNTKKGKFKLIGQNGEEKKTNYMYCILNN